MKFIRDLLGKKRKQEPNRRAQGIESLEQSYRETIGSIVDETDGLKTPGGPSVSDVLTAVPEKVTSEVRVVELEKSSAPAADPAPASAPAMNIWDMEDDGTAKAETPAAPAAASAAAARSPARSRRTKTRLIGFEKSDGDVVDIFSDAPAAVPAKNVKFPVGWIVVAEGPGRGESFSLLAGMSQIGRGEDQAIQLDFGDNSISRTNHAAIVFDADTKEFLLGHGGKSNIVRLNDKPLISNEQLKTGDLIRIGETVLRFVALCNQTFSWTDGATEEDEDVAIA
ncbi:FHA domain-containing protein [Yoonia sp. F2084L]|uniref:FHA domain-containing protein n=1 Tax=Yoonia sp. F2084L TaxID=2926419 RepID=UPI001FF12511|nr:FHA domain-containing protein [Yoonia sp. F2084L]MCK0095859.1 FHA domain-containing protein [Yoonia sp. F2084L]